MSRCERKFVGVLVSDVPPDAIILLNYVVEEFSESMRLERVDRNKRAWRQRGGEVPEVSDRGMARRMNYPQLDTIFVEPGAHSPGALMHKVSSPHRIGQRGSVQGRIDTLVAHDHRAEQHSNLSG